MTYSLYNRRGSGGYAVEATMVLAGVNYRLEEVASIPDQPLDGKIPHLNRWGQLPVLILPDGRKLTETAAMLIWLAQTEQGCQAGPHLRVEDMASFLRWTVFLSANVYEGILRDSYPWRFFQPDDEAAKNADSLDEETRQNIQRAAVTRNREALLCLEKETAGHAFLLGGHLSPCDIYLAMLYGWCPMDEALPKCNRIIRHVAMHPQINALWEKNFASRLDIKWHEGA